MENDRLQEHESLMHELVKGKELAEALEKQLREPSSSDNSNSNRERLVQNILASYSEALSILSGRDTQGHCASPSSDPPNSTQSKDSSERKFGDDLKTIQGTHTFISPSSYPPGSSISSCEVTQSKHSSSASLKRKSRQDVVSVKISGEACDDGYSWRKYGHKDILNSLYPRSYYRCVHRHTQGCMATKTVQRLDDEPNVFDATYRGEHTCHARAFSSELESLDKEADA